MLLDMTQQIKRRYSIAVAYSAVPVTHYSDMVQSCSWECDGISHRADFRQEGGDG